MINKTHIAFTLLVRPVSGNSVILLEKNKVIFAMFSVADFPFC